ncbi:MAG TPA: FMN-binding negative transcriptional regulator [Candidatus Binataceae bacterium]|nr:FMN-binding negative transcriptional regulator [Candidatus Binataceae bacterium]
MYIPKAFEVTDTRILHQFIEAHSFATIVSNDADAMLASHVPLTLEHAGGAHPSLAGHFARANPHWRALAASRQCLAIFNGPHSYISPSWYATAPAVPTWNYAAVHVYGRARIIDDSAWVAGLLDRMIAIYEARQARPWPGILPVEFRAKLTEAIVGFEIEIDRIEGKFKLGQNRPAEDQLGALRNLERGGDAAARELASLIRSHLEIPPDHDDRRADLGGAK